MNVVGSSVDEGQELTQPLSEQEERELSIAADTRALEERLFAHHDEVQRQAAIRASAEWEVEKQQRMHDDEAEFVFHVPHQEEHVDQSQLVRLQTEDSREHVAIEQNFGARWGGIFFYASIVACIVLMVTHIGAMVVPPLLALLAATWDAVCRTTTSLPTKTQSFAAAWICSRKAAIEHVGNAARHACGSAKAHLLPFARGKSARVVLAATTTKKRLRSSPNTEDSTWMAALTAAVAVTASLCPTVAVDGAALGALDQLRKRRRLASSQKKL
jgi:hypothetical protein